MVGDLPPAPGEGPTTGPPNSTPWAPAFPTQPPPRPRAWPAIALATIAVLLGIAAQTITVSTNSLVQLSTEPAMRGRVIAILMAVLMGSTPVGAPFVGWIANEFGPRWALGVAALSGFGGALVGWRLWKKQRRTTMSAPVSS